eukprot:gene10988-3694_t
MNILKPNEKPVNENIDFLVNILFKNGGIIIFVSFIGTILYLFTDYFSDFENNETMEEKNLKLSNLRFKKDWNGILEETKTSKNLLSLSFRAEAFEKINESTKFKAIVKHILSTKSKTSFDSFSIGKIYHLLNDEENAFKFFIKSLDEDVNKKNSIAFHNIASYYQRGLYVQKDLKKAREYLEKGVSMNDSFCEYFLGINLLKENSKRAIELLKNSSKKGNIQATIKLGKLFFEKKEYKKSLDFFKNGSESKSSVCLYYLSFMIMYGLGIEKDEKKAFSLLEKSISINQDPDSLFLMSKYLKEGKGVKKDEKKAFEICNSINSKNGEIYYHLALFHLEGKGVEKDESKYLENLKISMKLMYPDAYFLMGINLIQSSKNEKNIELGIDYLKKASNLGNLEALNILKQLNKTKI